MSGSRWFIQGYEMELAMGYWSIKVTELGWTEDDQHKMGILGTRNEGWGKREREKSALMMKTLC
jgi:hypothetical protein